MRKVRRKAQVSMEYLMVMGFAMLILIPVIIVFHAQTRDLNDNVNLNQARKVTRELLNAVHSVYYMGEPSQTIVKVNLPEDINRINISGREILFVINTQGGLTDIYEVSDVNLTGSISTSSGLHIVKVEALANSVNVSEVV